MDEPIDITPGMPLPPGDPAAARRQMRIGLLAAAAVAVVLAGGAGYAAVSPPVERRPTVFPVVTEPALPYAGETVRPAPSAARAGKSARRNPR